MFTNLLISKIKISISVYFKDAYKPCNVMASSCTGRVPWYSCLAATQRHRQHERLAEFIFPAKRRSLATLSWTKWSLEPLFLFYYSHSLLTDQGFLCNFSKFKNALLLQFQTNYHQSEWDTQTWDSNGSIHLCRVLHGVFHPLKSLWAARASLSWLGSSHITAMLKEKGWLMYK